MIDINALIEEVASVLGGIPDFADSERRHTGMASRITPPCVIVEPGQDIRYDQTYGPAGMDSFVLDVSVVAALLSPRSSWSAIAPYVSKFGPRSVPGRLWGAQYVTCSDLSVPSAELVVLTFAGTQYLGVTFRVEAGG